MMSVLRRGRRTPTLPLGRQSCKASPSGGCVVHGTGGAVVGQLASRETCPGRAVTIVRALVGWKRP